VLMSRSAKASTEVVEALAEFEQKGVQVEWLQSMSPIGRSSTGI